MMAEKFIKELHLTLKSGTSDSRKDWFAAGDYKKLPNEVGGMDTALPEEVEEYIKNGTPEQKERAENWQIAIGLQDVDNLKVSQALIELARRHIEGKITIEEVEQRIWEYHNK